MSGMHAVLFWHGTLLAYYLNTLFGGYFFKLLILSNIFAVCSAGIIAHESESLFTYRSAESWSNFYCPGFLPVFAPTFSNTTLEKEARKICGDNSFCLFDIAATKRVEIGAATMQGIEMLNNIIAMSKPSECVTSGQICPPSECVTSGQICPPSECVTSGQIFPN